MRVDVIGFSHVIGVHNCVCGVWQHVSKQAFVIICMCKGHVLITSRTKFRVVCALYAKLLDALL